MIPQLLSIELFKASFVYLMGAALLGFLFAPLLTALLYRFKIVRRSEHDYTLQGENRQYKAGTPIMGGLLVILVVILITMLFNWERKYTYVPIGVMSIAAILGAADDLLNVHGVKRRQRNIKHTLLLIKVHKKWYMKLWYTITLPWTAVREYTSMLGSKQNRGVQVHEKLLLQFVAGAIAAWWVYTKLGPSWHSVWLPFYGDVAVGWWIVPIIIFFVMFTANAVNVTDGMDGLAGGSLIGSFMALTLLSWIEGRSAFTPLNATVVGALIAYTYFNIKPARFQMGDVGSLGLGALLAINAISINKTILIPFIGFLFYLEIASVMIQVVFRRLFGRRFFKMSPLHHHFEIAGWNEERIVMRFWMIHMLMVIFAVWLALN